jgi:hypothetical protein
MKRRSTTGSLTALSLSLIWAPIGAAIVGISFLLVGRMPAGAPSVRSPVMPTVRTSFPTSAACPWRPPINCFVTGVILTERARVELLLLRDRSRSSTPLRHRHRHFRRSMFPSLRAWTDYTLQERQMYHLQRQSHTVVARLLRMVLIFGISSSLRRMFHLGCLLGRESRFHPLIQTSHCSLR